MSGRAILTLQVLKGARGIPVATTGNSEALRTFKRIVLEEWESKMELAGDEIEVAVYSSEIQRLRRVLELLIPEVGEVSQTLGPDENS